MQEVEKQFSIMAVKARTAIRKRALDIHPELQPLGYRVLSILVSQQAQQQIVLASELHVDKATMSRTIKQLQSQGLVTREPDPSDGRAMLVSITDTAREAWVASGARARSLMRERLADWEPAEIRRFADLLARLNDSESEPGRGLGVASTARSTTEPPGRDRRRRALTLPGSPSVHASRIGICDHFVGRTVVLFAISWPNPGTLKI